MGGSHCVGLWLPPSAAPCAQASRRRLDTTATAERSEKAGVSLLARPTLSLSNQVANARDQQTDHKHVQVAYTPCKAYDAFDDSQP